MKELFKKKSVRVAALAAGCVAVVYALIYVDVVLRARTAFLEGEKYWAWHHDPGLKRRALDDEFERKKAALEKKRSRGKIGEEEYRNRLEVLQFDHERKKEESAIKYAYVWYQTAVELFSPPESAWVRRAREKLPKAKELWKEELKAKKIPFEEYMLE